MIKKVRIQNYKQFDDIRGLSFKRFLDIAKIVGNNVVVVTDNDGDIALWQSNF